MIEEEDVPKLDINPLSGVGEANSSLEESKTIGHHSPSFLSSADEKPKFIPHDETFNDTVDFS